MSILDQIWPSGMEQGCEQLPTWMAVTMPQCAYYGVQNIAADTYSKAQYGTLPPLPNPAPNAPQTQAEMTNPSLWTPEQSLLQPGQLAQEFDATIDQYTASGQYTPKGIQVPNPFSGNIGLVLLLGIGIVLIVDEILKRRG